MYVYYSLLLVLIIMLIVIISNIKYKYKREYYQNSNSELSERQIIVSLTTSPIRIANIQPVIDSIMQQTIVPHKIVLNLPHVFKRFNSTFDQIPDFLTNNNKILINRCEDIGPLTKILPTVSIAESMEDILISIDDDIVYPTNTIEGLLNASKQYPDNVIANSAKHNYKDNLYSALEGWCGVLYKKKFLVDFNLDEIKDYNKACYLSDDFTLSNYLAKQNIGIIGLGINSIFWSENRILGYWNGEDALHNNEATPWSDYKDCILQFKEKNQYYMHPDYFTPLKV